MTKKDAVDLTGARDAFERAVALGPRSAIAHREYARWLLTSGTQPNDLDRGVAEARRAVALDVADADASLVLGQALMQQGHSSDAIAPLYRAATQNTVNPTPAPAA